MNETRAWRAIAVGVGAALAAMAVGCHPNSGVPANNPPTPAAYPPPNGYAGSSPPPPGYPGAYVPSAPPGNPQQPPAQAAYPASPPYTAQPPLAGGAPAPAAPPPGAWPQSPPAAGAPPGYPSAQAQPPRAASSAPAAPLAPTDPNSLQSILAGIQGALQGILVAPGSLPADITEAGLKAQAIRLAPGMQPEGAELKQTLSEGQHAVMMVTLQAGKCYALLGFSAPGAVKDLDLNLLAPPFYVTLAGQALSHDNAPSIGAAPGPMCPIIAFPLQYKLDVYAKSGRGPVAVQLYSKAKQ